MMVVPQNSKARLCGTHDIHTASAAVIKRPTVGILAFESAATMSRLVSLHHSLSDPSLLLLRSDIMRSPGVAYLTSADQLQLFRLVFSDVISSLDSSAAVVTRLSSRCHSHQQFPLSYARLKSGLTPFARSTSSKSVHRRVRQMEKSVALVALLSEEMEALDAMARKKPPPHETELRHMRKKVTRLKEESLWNKSFDEVVSLMSRSVLAIFARICVVFGPFVADLPPVLVSNGRFSIFPFSSRFRIYPRLAGRRHTSGPMELAAPPASKEIMVRNSCPIVRRGGEGEAKSTDTVGRAGLALRYANVVVAAERWLRMRCGEVEVEEGEAPAAREEIYRLLPVRLQSMVKGRLRDRWRERGPADGELARGWREAVERILRWLGPMAGDTVARHEEKALDRRRRLDTGPRVISIQTLEFSDKEKTEAAIVEVLVGISCMCWYDGRETAATRGGGRGR